MPNLVSIIICTCNREAELAKTLSSMAGIRLPMGLSAELIVVDNASRDQTKNVVGQTQLANMPLEYLHEGKQGQSHARNSGLARARGEFILFTDDDVRPAEDWVEKMVSALQSGGLDAVVGQIDPAAHLRRSWLGPQHGLWLAAPDSERRGALELIGANMGFRRTVLERVPRFDPELGPGALGFGDDSLFSWQLAEAGFRIGFASKAGVVHHFDSARLARSAWLDAARRRGQTEAYLLHHWLHGEVKQPRARRFWFHLKLRLRRQLQPPPSLESEGCPCWEMSYVLHMAKCERFQIERTRPRNYAFHGLQKRNLDGAEAPPVAFGRPPADLVRT